MQKAEVFCNIRISSVLLRQTPNHEKKPTLGLTNDTNDLPSQHCQSHSLVENLTTDLKNRKRLRYCSQITIVQQVQFEFKSLNIRKHLP